MSGPDLAEAVTVACLRFVNGGATRVTCLSRAPASGSYRVLLSDGQSVIAKLYLNTSKWRAAKERDIIESLSGGSVIRTAKVLGHGHLEDHDASVLITSDLGDATLWRAITAGTCSYHDGLGLIGQLLADFHRVDLATFPIGEQTHSQSMVEQHVRQFLSILGRNPADRLASRVRPALETLIRLCGQPREQVECHGDLHPANVVMCQLKSGTLAAHLIDFGSAVRCLPEYDLAKSIVTSSSALLRDERTALLAGYGGRHQVSDELLDAFVVFHVVDGWVHAAMLEGRDQSLWQGRVEAVLARYAALF